MRKVSEEIKQKAITLRKQGLSYGDIRKQTGLSKSTLSFFLKEIVLTESQRKALYTKQIILLNASLKNQTARRRKEIDEIINTASKEVVVPLSKETVRLLGCFLYWAEGTKGKGFEMTNSDPSLILFMVHWIEEVFLISPHFLRARLNIYNQQNEKSIKRFWSELCDIPLENFGKSYIKPTNKNWKKNVLYYGTIKITIPKSTDLKHRIFGWIQGTLKDTIKDTSIHKQGWNKLRNTKRPANLHKKTPPITQLVE